MRVSCRSEPQVANAEESRASGGARIVSVARCRRFGEPFALESRDDGRAARLVPVDGPLAPRVDLDVYETRPDVADETGHTAVGEVRTLSALLAFGPPILGLPTGTWSCFGHERARPTPPR